LNGASRRTWAIAGNSNSITSVIISMPPGRRAIRPMRMRNELRAVAGAAVVAVLIAGCGSNPAPRPVIAHGVAVREPLVNPRPYGTADAAFGLDVLGAVCRSDPRSNLVLSPSSLASGLGMAYLGARGGTARAMAGVLRLPVAGGQALEAGLQARSAALRGLGGPGVTLAASDQVWADPTLPTERTYLNAVATGYGAGLAKAPLLKDPELARQEINQAIADATRDQIPQLLRPGSLDDRIGWVLTDSLYLHAAWATPFDPDATSPGSFTTAAGRTVTAQFMEGGEYRAVTADGWTAVWLPYRGGKLGMEALLPPAGSAGCAQPAAAALGAMTSGLAPGQPGTSIRSISLPKVNIATQVSMKPVLTGLGMGVAFSPAADFTGLSSQACCIGLVEHAATLDVGEKGTVASAATAVGMEASAARVMPPVITFDRPYLMVVTDRATGEPLFMARIADPSRK
jgi:serpin B